jgi:hypothetical protein
MSGHDIGTGASIVFATTAFAAEWLDFDFNSISREAINVSHMGTTTWHDFDPVDLIDPGNLEVEYHFFLNDGLPPIDQPKEVITLTFPKTATGVSTAGNVSGTGFLTELSFGVPLEDKMVARSTIKWDGALTFTAEVP